MNKKQLAQYRALKREAEGLERSIEKLRDQALDVPVVAGKVMASSRDWPYIPEYISVEMDKPKEADAIERRIRIKEQRKQEAERLALEIEGYIAGIADSTDRQIFELTFLEGMTYREVGEIVHLDCSRISRRIADQLENATNATK